jgi:hypothetical protein
MSHVTERLWNKHFRSKTSPNEKYQHMAAKIETKMRREKIH